jgi:DEAD/DEAH box helicase domain-containing protein
MRVKTGHAAAAPARGMAIHRPLRSKRDAAWCDGSANGDSPFMIQRHRALGYEVTADVFDLQLFGIKSASVALPLAAALRDALARKLGVEDAELGIATSETRAEDGVGRWSVLIYDKAPGGAGFSISASVHIEDLLRDAAKILDCPNGTNCTTGCPGCVMCRDLEAHESIIDRLEALRFIRGLVQQLGLPLDLAVFGRETRPESQPLVDAIMREMERDHEAELRINLFGQPGDWDLARWPVLRVAHRLASRGRCHHGLKHPRQAG